MKIENQNILEHWEKIPQGCFALQGVIFPMSQFEAVLTAWFSDKPLPTPK